MNTVDIGGTEVIFPFPPYRIQIDYMNAVMRALEKKQNALLESPTGTGKTLSLLCSTLAWLNKRKFQDLELTTAGDISNQKDYSALNQLDSLTGADENNLQPGKPKGGKGWVNESPIRIIYSSRTHTQLNQACAELKRSYYKFTPTITLGSRDQLCINPEVKNLESVSKNQSCRMKVKNNTCNFHHNYEKKVSDLSFDGAQVFDIEDLINFGNEHKACPYYMAKAKTTFNTSLIFMPYNYILDPSIRRTLRLNLENCVIIFDEGHNIERVCEDSMSTEMKSDWLSLFIETFDGALRALKQLEDGQYQGINEKELSELNIHEVAQVKMLICDLEAEIQRLVHENAKKDQSKTPIETAEIFRIFERVGLDYSKCATIASVCEKLIAYVMSSITAYMSNATINALTSVCSFLETVIPFSGEGKKRPLDNFMEQFVNNYKIYTEIDTQNNFSSRSVWQKRKTQESWTIYLLCMSPSLAIKSLQRLGVYNLIITSGTLSPLESFEFEMAIPFAVKLQNSHVISQNQLSLQLVAKDPTGLDLSGSYDNRKSPKYFHGVGNTILELSRIIPKGIFIFFSSYSLINQCIEVWKSMYLWEAISSVKKIYVEPRNKNEFHDYIEAFKEAVDNTSGAIFMGVSRGKLSEGIDLGDDYCRGVIIIGLPYPAKNDFKVRLKEKYLDESNSKISGKQWYILQMKRALNQSIGRIIRHKNDYGLIIICDSRFYNIDGLSRWIQAFIHGSVNANLQAEFRLRIRNIQQFFIQASGVVGGSLPALSNPKIASNTGPKAILPVSTSAGVSVNQSGNSLVAQQSSSSDLFESTFNAIKNSSMASINKRGNSHLKSDNSLFDSIYSNSSEVNKKRHFDQNNSQQSSLSISAKKVTVKSRKFDGLDYFRKHQIEEIDLSDDIIIVDEDPSLKKRNERIRNSSKYFNQNSISSGECDTMKFSPCKTTTSNCDDLKEEIEIIDIEKENEKKSARENISAKSCPSVALQPCKEEIVDIMDCKEIASLCLNEHNRQAVKSIVHELKDSDLKHRQYIETLSIFSKKRNVSYLALRMNFILENMIDAKRSTMLKDLSLIVPERERNLFLRICKVAI